MQISKSDLLVLFIIVLGVILQSSSLWFTGTDLGYEIFFCCGNYHDNLFHAALTNELVKNFPPFQPGLYGVVVQNYHYLSNIVVSEMIRIYGLPLFITQFQYFSIFLSLFLGFAALTFSQIIKAKNGFVIWFLFFLYFGGDLLFLPLSFASGKIDFSMSSLEDGAKFLENLPRSYSIVLLISLLSFMYLWLRNGNRILGLTVALIAGTLIGFKVYTGIFAIIGLVFIAFYLIFFKRDFIKIFYIALSIVLGLIIYLPVNAGAGGMYFIGLWRFENLIAQPQLGLIRLELEREIFRTSGNWPRIVLLEILYFTFYIVAVFGTKIISIFQTKNSFKLIPIEIHIFLLPSILISLILGFFFNQTSGGANTFNFLVGVFIISSMYAALAAYYWGERLGKFKAALIITLVLLTIPRVAFSFYTNISNIIEKDGFHISKKHIEAFKHINENTPKNSIIFVDQRYFDKDIESPYVSIYTNRPMFLSSIGILRSHGINYQAREDSTKNIIYEGSAALVANEVLENNISYFLMKNDAPIFASEAAKFITLEFLNDEVKVMKVDREKAKNFLIDYSQ